ncbi:hypothetical protein Pcar_2826 [Syntrophotalea carbinolica DSM 2380]|uniref:TIGR02270 family protein n=1 Tax=Syntrophotalea carbinolica (strain DSM 2380 / NBRC 103641 / GraBd1) TaxID=338963 RepID=Q3A0P6_SYNC1|nr:hypothetical protein [Syntrophotalea carbinolica]ABA90061.1 hypothetical protein Pcar_2826 [Syntrophotalea carbinolica DSM 2380]
MNVPLLSTHYDSALALYRQRCQQQQAALVDAHVMARQEKLLWTHLHVLSRCAPLEMEPAKEAEFFVDLVSRFLSPSAEMQQEGYELALSLLQKSEPGRQGAFQALALLPPPEKDARLLDLYRQDKTLRPLLFDLWREQSWPVPAGLVSVAELRGHDNELQIAALRYAASQPKIGVELFTAYYQGLLSGGARPEKSGHLLATALWGGLLRGERNLAKPLWRCIESETNPDDLYHLLRLGSIIALPEIIPVIKHYSGQHPESAAELLALHGTGPALQTLKDLSQGEEIPPGAVDAWKWVSGRRLLPGPRLHVVPTAGESEAPPALNTIEHWWQHRLQLEEGQRLLMGEVFSTDHLLQQCRAWGGRYSDHLLDLLSFITGSPLGVTGKALQFRRLQAIRQTSTEAPPMENQYASA